MQVLTSLSGLPISAASAGFSPTNSADVSAIASGYQVVSSTATQLNAGTAYLTSVNDAPISASRAGQAANASLATSAYYDGTGRLISALPDSAAVSAIASSYAESAASGKQDELTFGYDANNLISSIDGSALAGQGGGGGGLITSIESSIDPWFRTAISGLNGSSLYPKWAESAQSAAVATNASSASTAHYAQSAPTAWASSFITGVASPSGTIRVQGGTAIEATNSAVLPSTVIEGFSIEEVIGNTTNTTSLTLPVSNPTTRVHFGDAYGAPGTFAIDTDNGLHIESSLESYFDVTFELPNATSLTATYPWVANLKYTASASFVEEGGGVGELAWASALPTYEYDGDGKISAIDGSALAGGGGGGATGDYVEKSATSVVIGPSSNTYQYSLAAGGKVSAFQQSLAVGSSSIASTNSIAVGNNNSADYESVAVGSYASAYHYSEAFGFYALAENNSFAHEGTAKYGSVAFGNGMGVSAYENSVAMGSGVTAKFTSMAIGTNNLSGNGSGASGAAFVIGDGTSTGARHDLMVVTKDGEITMFSGTADTVGTGIMSSIRAISAAATGGGGGLDSATVSAIASAYVESGVSSKLDSSASSDFYSTGNPSGFVDSKFVESSVSSKLDTTAFNSGDFYSTGNPSGFVDSAYVESSVSGKQDASAMSSYALSSDVSGTVDLVSSQSANWGGSALQLSAGDGISLTLSGNILIIATASA